MSVHKKLQEARVKLQNTKIAKSGLNKFAGYQYFELGDFMPIINQIFNDVGLCGVISFSTETATLTITDIESGKEIIITSPSAEVVLKGCLPIQGLGAAQTYLRRYLWIAALEIVEHDALDALTGKDDGNAASKAPRQEPVRMETVRNFDPEITKLKACGSISALSIAWSKMDKATQHVLATVKDECKNAILAAEKAAEEVPA